MRKTCLPVLLFLCSVYSVFAQTVDDLFQQRNSLLRDYHAIASKYEALQLNPQRLADLRQQSPANLQLELPFENGQLKLQLKKVKITSDDFSVIEALPDGSRRKIDYSGAVFYQGKIEGMSSSFATISIVNEQVMGIIADNKSNIILGAIENNGWATNEYTLYRESDLAVDNPLKCFTSDTPGDGSPIQNNNQGSGRIGFVGEPVYIYFECDYKFYQDKGSNTTNVINFVLGFFNSVSLLYANEDINIQVSQILVWTTEDPEAKAGLGNTNDVLNLFAGRMLTANYIGYYAHFLSTRPIGGGRAILVTNPCLSPKPSKCAVSGISNSYINFPMYSYTIFLVTHELGHNLGSRHTHSCSWPGALDNCAATEGGCTPGPPPVNGGTIMSYCQQTSYGINFNNGFGPLPGQAIRNVVIAATCFGTACGNVTSITATPYSPSRVIIHWYNPPNVTADTLQYRKAGTTAWNRVFVTGYEYELNGLEPNTNYEYNIIPICNTTTVFIPSSINVFKTSSLNEGHYVRLFPNPSAKPRLEIIMAAGFTLQVSLFDNTGKKIKTISQKENLPAGQVIKEINTGVLPNGIYHLAVTINGKTQNLKMIVMH